MTRRTVTLDETELERLIGEAGYDVTTPVAVGVGSAAAMVLTAHGGALGDRFDAESVGYAGSLAKQVTGACAVLLERAGTLDVEAPIAQSLPELPRWAASIRVRHLIHHTAGLPTTDTVWERMEARGERDWTSDGVIGALSELAPVRPPGGAHRGTAVAKRPRGLRGRTSLSASRTRRDVAVVRPGRIASRSRARPADAAACSPVPGRRWTLDVRARSAGLECSVALGHARDRDLLHRTGSLDDGTPLDYAWGVRVAAESGRLIQSHGGSWEGAAAKLVRLPEVGSRSWRRTAVSSG